MGACHFLTKGREVGTLNGEGVKNLENLSDVIFTSLRIALALGSVALFPFGLGSGEEERQRLAVGGFEVP